MWAKNWLKQAEKAKDCMSPTLAFNVLAGRWESDMWVMQHPCLILTKPPKAGDHSEWLFFHPDTPLDTHNYAGGPQIWVEPKRPTIAWHLLYIMTWVEGKRVPWESVVTSFPCLNQDSNSCGYQWVALIPHPNIIQNLPKWAKFWLELKCPTTISLASYGA